VSGRSPNPGENLGWALNPASPAAVFT
jgi:hypothetical protein